jgi:hypothetical protein
VLPRVCAGAGAGSCPGAACRAAAPVVMRTYFWRKSAVICGLLSAIACAAEF